MDVSRAESCTFSQVRVAAPLLFALPALLIYMAWGSRCDLEKGSGAAHRASGSAEKSNIPAEITKRLRNENAHCCQMQHLWRKTIGDWLPGCCKEFVFVSEMVCAHACVHTGVCTHACAATREEGRQRLRGFGVTRGGQSSHDLSICQKPPHSWAGNEYMRDSGQTSCSPG